MNADQALCMSVISAVLELRSARAHHPDAAWLDLALLLGERGMFSLDFQRAIDFNCELGWLELPNRNIPRAGQIRDVVHHVLQITHPIWLEAVPYGLRSVREAITEDTSQALESADLLGESLDRSAIEWWDNIASEIRKDIDSSRLIQGRKAEELSLNYEIKLLGQLGIKDRTPRWMSIEDNSLGYDILSFRFSPTGDIRETLIEVKSTTKSYPSFFVTRNEWKRAKSSIDKYQFQIWVANNNSPVEISANQIACHIPSDQGKGAWQDVLIELR